MSGFSDRRGLLVRIRAQDLGLGVSLCRFRVGSSDKLAVLSVLGGIPMPQLRGGGLNSEVGFFLLSGHPTF